jgi:hypothetical protein
MKREITLKAFFSRRQMCGTSIPSIYNFSKPVGLTALEITKKLPELSSRHVLSLVEMESTGTNCYEIRKY